MADGLKGIRALAVASGYKGLEARLDQLDAARAKWYAVRGTDGRETKRLPLGLFPADPDGCLEVLFNNLQAGGPAALVIVPAVDDLEEFGFPVSIPEFIRPAAAGPQAMDGLTMAKEVIGLVALLKAPSGPSFGETIKELKAAKSVLNELADEGGSGEGDKMLMEMAVTGLKELMPSKGAASAA